MRLKRITCRTVLKSKQRKVTVLTSASPHDDRVAAKLHKWKHDGKLAQSFPCGHSALPLPPALPGRAPSRSRCPGAGSSPARSWRPGASPAPRRPPRPCHRRRIYDFRCRSGGQRSPTPRETKALARRSAAGRGDAGGAERRRRARRAHNARPRGSAGPAARAAALRESRRRGRGGGARPSPPTPTHPSRTGGEEPPADGPLDEDRRQPLPRAGRAPRRAGHGRARRGCGAERGLKVPFHRHFEGEGGEREALGGLGPPRAWARTAPRRGGGAARTKFPRGPGGRRGPGASPRRAPPRRGAGPARRATSARRAAGRRGPLAGARRVARGQLRAAAGQPRASLLGAGERGSPRAAAAAASPPRSACLFPPPPPPSPPFSRIQTSGARKNPPGPAPRRQNAPNSCARGRSDRARAPLPPASPAGSFSSPAPLPGLGLPGAPLTASFQYGTARQSACARRPPASPPPAPPPSPPLTAFRALRLPPAAGAPSPPPRRAPGPLARPAPRGPPPAPPPPRCPGLLPPDTCSRRAGDSAGSAAGNGTRHRRDSAGAGRESPPCPASFAPPPRAGARPGRRPVPPAGCAVPSPFPRAPLRIQPPSPSETGRPPWSVSPGRGLDRDRPRGAAQPAGRPGAAACGERAGSTGPPSRGVDGHPAHSPPLPAALRSERKRKRVVQHRAPPARATETEGWKGSLPAPIRADRGGGRQRTRRPAASNGGGEQRELSAESPCASPGAHPPARGGGSAAAALRSGPLASGRDELPGARPARPARSQRGRNPPCRCLNIYGGEYWCVRASRVVVDTSCWQLEISVQRGRAGGIEYAVVICL
ncbi:basic proline-rich protein-like [Caloenas nicobarica]|uniref:basic proline-rich protein-like n=1 Tax=Caloenas nicobarica TaxID=187106 RepID=UPI0032B7B2EA